MISLPSQTLSLCPYFTHSYLENVTFHTILILFIMKIISNMEFPHLFYQLEQYWQLLTMWGLKNIPSLSIHERFTSLSNSRRFWKNKNVFLPNFPKWQVHNDFSKKHIWFLCMWFNPDLQHRLGDIINGTIIPVLYFFFK